MSFFLVLLLLTVSFCPEYGIAQYTYELDKTTRFEKMGVEEGLSTGYVYCLHQDKYGFMWIGTQFGLNLYNGYEFKTFNADLKNPPSLPNGWIYDIFEEEDGTMWFCTELGISKYNRANQSFRNYIPDSINLRSKRNSVDNIVNDGECFWVDVQMNDLFRFDKSTGEFQSFACDTLQPKKGIYYPNAEYIFIDGSGILWVCSGNGEGDFVLSKFNKQTETFTHFQNLPSAIESFNGKQVMSMIEDNEGIIWIATHQGGLLKVIDKEKGKFKEYIHDENDLHSIVHNNLQKVFKDTKGNIWIGGTKGFSRIKSKSGVFTNYHIPNRTDFTNRPNVIYDMNEGANGELFLSSRGGLFRFNPSSKVLTHYLYDPENPDGISDNLIYEVITDHTGQTWIVAPNSGLNRLNPFSNAFIRIQKRSNDDHSLSKNYTSSFLKDSRGNFWVGTFGGGLNRTKIDHHRDFDHFEHFIHDDRNPMSISDNRITTIYEDRDHMIWFGTFWGLNKYDYNTNSFTPYQYVPNDITSLNSDMVEAMIEDSYGTFWVGTRSGLNIMNRETGKFIRFIPNINDSSSILSTNVRSFLEDSYGELWFGGHYLEKLERKDTSFSQYLPDTSNRGDLQRFRSWVVVEDDSTNLWLSSSAGGLYKMNRNTMTFTAITVDQGLSNNHVNAIEFDDRGFIWVSTNKGLSMIDRKDYSIRNFDLADGLVGLEFYERSSYKDDEGWLYFGSMDGFNVFHPDSLRENKFIPPVYITSLNIAGNPQYFDKPLYEMSSIDLHYSENDLSFDFVALNYINSQKNQYAYMLEGYDEEWIYAGNRRTAYYTNLGPGEYTFRVKGSNNDGYWNEAGASLALVILPPFWRTWWAYLVYAFSFVVLVYVMRRNELKKIYLRQELELKQAQAEQQAELDREKSKFFSNISHEFRTPLTLILGPLDRYIGKLDNEGQKQELNLVRRNARRLQVLINQLLSVSKLESGTMKLRARPNDIVKLTRLFVQTFHSMAVDKGIRLDFESDLEACIVYLDAGKYEKVVNNLLSNAFKFTERGGTIKITVHAAHEGAGGVTIKFSDTGMGIKKEDLAHVFDRFYQVDEKQMKTNLGTGIGLALTKELVELHRGTITVESDPDSYRDGMGTTFTIFLPTGTYHLSPDEVFEAGIPASQTEDELLNDDYLFAEEMPAKSDLQKEVPANSDLSLILIVEDNDDMRSYIKSYLVDSYNIIEASNGKEGADQAIEQIPDLIVSDLMMPKLDGNEMTLQLKTDERTSHIPIILLTAKASKESKLEGLETGADDFLSKPFDADELQVRVNNLIIQRKKLREVFGKKLSFAVSPGPAELKDSGITSMDEQFLKKAYEAAEREMANPEFDVSSFSKQMGLSRMQLHRKLTALTNQSASDFIRIVRLNKAAVLLKSKSATAAEIGYDVGFNSPSYFSTCFKEHFGITPTEYAK